jgi:hypothetical protein
MRICVTNYIKPDFDMLSGDALASTNLRHYSEKRKMSLCNFEFYPIWAEYSSYNYCVSRH